MANDGFDLRANPPVVIRFSAPHHGEEEQSCGGNSYRGHDEEQGCGGDRY